MKLGQFVVTMVNKIEKGELTGHEILFVQSHDGTVSPVVDCGIDIDGEDEIIGKKSIFILSPFDLDGVTIPDSMFINRKQ